MGESRDDVGKSATFFKEGKPEVECNRELNQFR